MRLEYRIPARGLIGFQGEFLTLTRGTGLASHIFDDYGPVKGDMDERRNGVLISQDDGDAVAYALWKLQERGRMFVSPGEALYEGMIIGIHSRDNDLVVNPIKGKQLTNVRASGTDEAVRLVPRDRTHAGESGGIHRRRRARRNHAEIDPPAQALPERARPQARLAHPGRGLRRCCRIRDVPSPRLRERQLAPAGRARVGKETAAIARAQSSRLSPGRTRVNFTGSRLTLKPSPAACTRL